MIYQIRLQGHLDQRWAEWFDPLVIDHTPHGETTLTGAVRDQAELYGLLIKVHNLNLTLLAVNQITSHAHPG